MAHEEPSARITLSDARSPAQTFEYELTVFSDGVKCRIGTSDRADLRLPRERYLDIAGQQLAIVFLAGGGIVLEVYQRALPCLLGGKPAEGAKLGWGEHVLDVGPHRFTMSLTK